MLDNEKDICQSEDHKDDQAEFGLPLAVAESEELEVAEMPFISREDDGEDVGETEVDANVDNLSATEIIDNVADCDVDDKAWVQEASQESESNSVVATALQEAGVESDVDAGEDSEEHNPYNIDVPDTAKWYIVHTYSGFELRVEQTINEMIRNGQAQGLIYQVVVPTERVEELGKGGEKRTAKRKFYPGYIMVQMTMTDYSWHVVQTIPKVTGFVGGKNRPTPMHDREADKILQLMRERQEKPRPKFKFDRGDDVRVIDGPFGGFNGVVDEVNYDKGKLKVSVSIFGRQTPVELDFVQVSKG